MDPAITVVVQIADGAIIHVASSIPGVTVRVVDYDAPSDALNLMALPEDPTNTFEMVVVDAEYRPALEDTWARARPVDDFDHDDEEADET
jgi:hypothetical protein